MSYVQNLPCMRQREPIRRHRGQAVRDGEGKDVRQETACGGLGSASWCLDENGVGTPCPSSRGVFRVDRARTTRRYELSGSVAGRSRAEEPTEKRA